MSLRLLLDEMYPPQLAQHLRSTGVDTAAVLEDGALVAATDAEVLRRAHLAGRAVVTENVAHFLPLAAEGHAGIVLLHGPRWPRTRAGQARIAVALAALDSSGYRQPAVHWLR